MCLIEFDFRFNSPSGLADIWTRLDCTENLELRTQASHWRQVLTFSVLKALSLPPRNLLIQHDTFRYGTRQTPFDIRTSSSSIGFIYNGSSFFAIAFPCALPSKLFSMNTVHKKVPKFGKVFDKKKIKRCFFSFLNFVFHPFQF